MPSGWLNLEAQSGDSVFGGEESAYSKLGLTKTQRLYGFLGCTVVGFILSILGTILLFIGGLISFAILFSIGIIVSLVGTGFLIGFSKQIKTMFKPVRVVATLILLGAIAMTFMGAFLLNNAVLCLVMVIVEYLAYLWYSLSYIPYARSLVKNLLPSWLRWD
ncbi:hypothetical protein NliqN6_5818 [Naganishia liquefaciens]|uniref:Protein transport protein SFT2 n=1 Tax=Naganishia liquefaciens TaxID=104408 RepID=A0A8H3TXI5_9TREE|nr:hypothetical protein NliqN6_5818 [Naganishia liquefaciens]